jgi:hypothetical protein
MSEEFAGQPYVRFVGDRYPPLELVVVDDEGESVTTAGWSVIAVTLVEVDTEVEVVGNGTLTFNADPITGAFTYEWGTTDLAAQGEYTVFFRFDTGTSIPVTFKWERQLVVEWRPGA